MIIRLKYRDRDPVMASKIINLVTEDYLRQHLDYQHESGPEFILCGTDRYQSKHS